MTFAHSWSNEHEPQAFQVDSTGKVLWQWNAKKFIKANKFKKSENRKEPKNFAAATSAVPIGKNRVAVTLSLERDCNCRQEAQKGREIH